MIGGANGVVLVNLWCFELVSESRKLPDTSNEETLAGEAGDGTRQAYSLFLYFFLSCVFTCFFR